METFSANVQIEHGIHMWTIPITVEVSFRQTFRESFNYPAEYEVNEYVFLGIGHKNDQRDYGLLENVVNEELYDNDLENVELL